MPPSPYHPSPEASIIPLYGGLRELSWQFVQLAELASTTSRTLRVGVGQSAWAAGLTESEVPVLRWCCAEQGGIAQKRLGEVLAVSSAHLSELLESLQRRGLVDARRLASDRRRQVWQASRAGRAAMETLFSALSGIVQSYADRLDPGKVGQLIALWEQVIAALQTTPSLPGSQAGGAAA
jgi:DNA-binding MarR family transcriptional regulator